jgi:hypothetical protein
MWNRPKSLVREPDFTGVSGASEVWWYNITSAVSPGDYEMKERIAEASPRFKARMAGVFYLFNILTGALALSASGRLGVAANLVAARMLYRCDAALLLHL